MRKSLYIIGARGFGREIAASLPTWNGFNDKYVISGFLDDKIDALEGFQAGYPPIVSSVEDFKPGENDVFICGLGAVEWRRKYIDIMLQKNAVFDTFIHNTSEITTRTIGKGVVIGAYAMISPDVTIGDFVLCHPNVVLGHDVKLASHVVLENGVFCGGFVEVGEGATIHTRATILPHKRIGSNAVVGACSCVVRNVKPGATVFGNPAQRIDQ